MGVGPWAGGLPMHATAPRPACCSRPARPPRPLAAGPRAASGARRGGTSSGGGGGRAAAQAVRDAWSARDLLQAWRRHRRQLAGGHAELVLLIQQATRVARSMHAAGGRQGGGQRGRAGWQQQRGELEQVVGEARVALLPALGKCDGR
jgi:hypothetical protein